MELTEEQLLAARIIPPVAELTLRSFFTDWIEASGEKTGQDIWRFQFPDSVLGQDHPKPEGFCLTNNYAVWREEVPVTLGNVDLGGRYNFSLAPDAIKDAKANADGWISFKDGHLTDRRQSMRDKKVGTGSFDKFENPDSRWMVGWKKQTTSAIDLTYDLQNPVNLTAVRFYFNGYMPKYTVQGSNNMSNWETIGDNNKMIGAGGDILDISTSLQSNSKYRYVRVQFAPRDEGQELTLIESEVWGKID